MSNFDGNPLDAADKSSASDFGDGQMDNDQEDSELENDPELIQIDRLLASAFKPQTQTDDNAASFIDTELAIGRFLPERFKILRRLGSGTFGVVFLCQDQRLKREVAVKVLRPEWMASRENRQRFLRESRAAARLNHTHIVRVLEADENEQVAWQVCDAIHGAALSTDIKTLGALPHLTAVRLMAELAEAVDHAHQMGIVHRDIKPDNILISGVPAARLDDAQAYLTDFGLAKLFSDDLDLSRSGTLLGTPRYMAPEQFDDNAAKNQPAADIYSLGVVLFECLTGHCPFSGASTLAGRLKQGLQSLPTPRSVNPEISRDLDSICSKAMEPRPADRYASAGQLSQDLRNYLLDLPISARPLSLLERTGRLVRNNRLTATLLGLILAGLLFTAMVLLVANYSIRRSNRLLSDTNQQLSRERTLAERLAVETKESKEKFKQLAWNSEIGQAYLHYERSQLLQASTQLAAMKSEFGSAEDRLEWQLLTRQIDSDTQSLLKLPVAIHEVCAIPNTPLVAAAGGDGRVYLLDLTTGKMSDQLELGTDALHALAAHPHKPIVAVGREPGVQGSNRLALFDWKYRSVLRNLRRLPSTVEAIEFSSDGRYVLAGARYENPMLLDLQENKTTRHVGSRRNTWLAYWATLGLFAFQKDESTIAFLDPERGEVVKELSLLKVASQYNITYATAIPESAMLAIADSTNDKLLLVNSKDGGVSTVLRLNSKSNVRCVVADPTGSLLACGQDNGQVHLWSISHSELETGNGLPTNTGAEALNETGGKVLSAFLAPEGPQEIRSIAYWRLYSSAINDLAFHDGKLVCAGEDGELAAIALPGSAGGVAGTQQPKITGLSPATQQSIVPDDLVVSAEWAKYSPVLSARFSNGQVARFDFSDLFASNSVSDFGLNQPATQENMAAVDQWSLRSMVSVANLVSPQADSKYLALGASVSADGTTIAWPQNSLELGVLRSNNNYVLKLFDPSERTDSKIVVKGISPDSKYVVLGTGPRVLQVRELAEPGLKKAEIAVDGDVAGVEWHPDGSSLYICGRFPFVMRYDLNNGSVQRMVENSVGGRVIRCINHGTMLLSTHLNGTLRFTSLIDGSSHSIAMHDSSILSMVLSSDESIGISVDLHGKLVVWSIPYRRRFGILSDLSQLGTNWQQPPEDGIALWLAPDGSQLLALYPMGSTPMIRRWKLK